MVRVVFTENIQRHVACPPVEVPAGAVREVLGAVFAGNEPARGYVLDEGGSLRRHMAVFVDGCQIRDPEGLSDVVPEEAEVYVMQALSGG